MPNRPKSLINSPEIFAETFAVSRETLDRLATYGALLRQWQKTINLVAPRTLDEIWHRHFADSAQLMRLTPPEAKIWVDAGSGAGFPGLVLAILAAGEKNPPRFTLLESDSRKAAFLGEVSRKTGVPVEIFVERIEKTATQNKFGPIDVLTARALAPLPKLLDLLAPLFSPRSIGLFLKGKDAQTEVDQARAKWAFEARLVPSLTDAAARVVVIENLSRLEGG